MLLRHSNTNLGHKRTKNFHRRTRHGNEKAIKEIRH